MALRQAWRPGKRLHDGLSPLVALAQLGPPSAPSPPSPLSLPVPRLAPPTIISCSTPAALYSRSIRSFASISLHEPNQGTVPEGAGEGPENGHGGQQGALPPTVEPTGLDILLRAVQRKDTASIHKAFTAWTDLLAEEPQGSKNAKPPSPERIALAIEQAQTLPGPTLSEILRAVDPLTSASASASNDIADSLALAQGQTQFFDLSHIMDRYGVRSMHRSISKGMESLMRVRGGSRLGLLPHDYQVMMRCAGAAMDYQLAKRFWAAMATHGLSRARTSATWADLLKARFSTEPLYYQFDRARVAVSARDIVRNRIRGPIPYTIMRRLDRIRLSINALQRQPWNRRPDQPDEDLRRLLRRRSDYRAFRNHWIRAAYYGHEMDEDLLCTSMIAFARSSSLHAIINLILQQYLGVKVTDPSDPANSTISGGHDFPPGSLIRPSAKFLDAIVEAFGSMSHIALGSRLLVFFSQRYDIPIPHATWSNLLQWTYVCASKPFRHMRRIHGPYASTTVTTDDVRHVWDAMTSPPYSITPTFDDLVCHIKTLIIGRNFRRARRMINVAAAPIYDALVADFEAALLDELLQLDAVAARSPAHPHYNAPGNFAIHRAVQRRQRAQLLRDHTYQQISSLLTRILKTAGRKSYMRRDAYLASRVIPHIIAKHAEFLPSQIRYRTRQGEVVLHRPGVIERFTWEPRFRTVEPQRAAGWVAKGIESFGSEDFEWPMTQPLRIREWVRKPKPQVAMGPPPRIRSNNPSWWGRLEQQLML